MQRAERERERWRGERKKEGRVRIVSGKRAKGEREGGKEEVVEGKSKTRGLRGEGRKKKEEDERLCGISGRE